MSSIAGKARTQAELVKLAARGRQHEVDNRRLSRRKRGRQWTRIMLAKLASRRRDIEAS